MKTKPLVAQPKVIRLKDAPAYLGMDRNRFRKMVRPYITEIRYGPQSVGFDRLELDEWVEDYKRRNGRPATHPKGEKAWDANTAQGFATEMGSGTLRNGSLEDKFAKALERATSKKPSFY